MESILKTSGIKKYYGKGDTMVKALDGIDLEIERGKFTAIILADEPTGNLDSKTSDDVIGLLKMSSREFHQTIVMITHNPDIAQQADRIVRIEDRRIMYK